MAAGDAQLHFRGIGGIYRIDVQDPTGNEYTCAVNWLAEAIAASCGHSRVYNDWAKETANIPAGTDFITYVWDHSDDDKYTHLSNVARTRVTRLYFEILVWKQGQDYNTIDAVAADLVIDLDVGKTDRGADGVILGAERAQFRLAKWDG